MLVSFSKQLNQNFEQSIDRTSNAGRCWKVMEMLPLLWQGVRYTHQSHIAVASGNSLEDNYVVAMLKALNIGWYTNGESEEKGE